MHTYKTCITFLSLLSISGVLSPAIAQNSWTNSTVNSPEIHQGEQPTENSPPGGTVRGGERWISQETKDETSKNETQHRGSGRFDNNEFV